jgi:hypothetical protein
MKKFLIAVLGSALLFASGSDDINKKLDRILDIVMQLKKQSDSQEKRIEKLEKALNIQKQELKKQQKIIKTQEKTVKNELAIKSCGKIKVLSFKDKYFGEVLPYYTLDFTLKNEYPKNIVFLEGDLIAEDSDGVKILQDLIKRDITLPAGASVKIHKKHLLDNDLEIYLKDENPKNLKIYFRVIKAKFDDGSVLECN